MFVADVFLKSPAVLFIGLRKIVISHSVRAQVTGRITKSKKTLKKVEQKRYWVSEMLYFTRCLHKLTLGLTNQEANE